MMQYLSVSRFPLCQLLIVSLEWLLLALCMMSAPVVLSDTATSAELELKCSSHPDGASDLCALITQSAFGPFDDVVFYNRDKIGTLSFLRAQPGSVSIFDDMGFSESGQYLWVTWRSEGHPVISIYRSDDFSIPYQRADAIRVFHQPGLDHIDGISKAGVALLGFVYREDGRVGCNAHSEKAMKCSLVNCHALDDIFGSP